MSTIQRCQDLPGIDQLGTDACAEFKKIDSPAWKMIVLDPLFDGKLPVREHSDDQQSRALYARWFHDLIYAFHHDYNQIAAETLACSPTVSIQNLTIFRTGSGTMMDRR